jgi:Holliday junction resolvasome RuvABC endonuclease subunit
VIIAAFDIATATGWCVGDVTRPDLPQLGMCVMPNTHEDIGPYLDFWDRWLGMQLEHWQVDRVIFEAPYIDAKRINATTTRKLMSLCSHLELLCHRAGLPVEEVMANTARASIGSGRFKKPDVMAAAKRCGLKPACYDESDAWAVWVCALKEHAPAMQPHWDGLLSRGLV